MIPSPSSESKPAKRRLSGDMIFAFALFGIVLLLILPISARLMDLLLAASMGISLLILLMVVYVKDPSDFSVFPTMLLAITLYRLGLNVASTRLILLDGYAGAVIQSFGNFAVRGNFVVGAVIFLILVIINFIVITKGAGRIAEVAARFTLDAMPGKQMAIDAELNAGIIDEATATKRRVKTQQEADFYGAMDGASKFVRGDAIAGILITFVNIVGGIAIGVFQHGLPLVESMHKYTLLSIGDGLVAQIPALIVSVGAGLLVTRTGQPQDLGSQVSKQISFYPKAMAITGAMLCIFGLIPGFPAFPFFLLGGLCFWLAKEMKVARAKAIVQEAGQMAQAKEAAQTPAQKTVAELAKIVHVDTICVECGYGLVALVDPKRGGDLLDRITGARKNLAAELGMIMPAIAVRDNPDLGQHEYGLSLREKELVRGSVIPGRLLAMNVSGSSVKLSGQPTKEPVFGLDAYWIDSAERPQAQANGYTVVDAASVIITHLSETLKGVAHLILEREDTQRLIDRVKETQPTLVAELLPDLVNVGIIQRVLQNLLRERISIKHLTLILETIADFAPITKNPDDLSEQVRRRLGVYFAKEFEAEAGLIKAMTLEPRLEQQLISRIKKTQFELSLVMDPAIAQHLMRSLSLGIKEMSAQGLAGIMLVTSDLRLAFKRFFEPSFPHLVVLAYQELPDGLKVENFGLITLPREEASAPAQST